jgi:glycine/D-amino acid oxidase-like deaminating enzyme
MAEAEKEIAHLRKISPAIAEQVTIVKDKEELKNLRVNPDCVGVTLSVGAGSLWPYKLVTYILEKLVKERNLNLQTNTPVTEISSVDGKHTLHTPRGAITSKTVILATNGYPISPISSSLAEVKCPPSFRPRTQHFFQTRTVWLLPSANQRTVMTTSSNARTRTCRIRQAISVRLEYMHLERAITDSWQCSAAAAQQKGQSLPLA